MDGTWTVGLFDNFGDTLPFSNVYVGLNAGRTGPTCVTGSCTVNPKGAFDDFRFVKHSALVAKAGDDKIITVGANAQLTGSATDQNGNSATATSYKWTFSSKPSGAPDPTIGSPTGATTTISNLSFVGVYNFQLTVSDGANSFSTDTVRITVADVPVSRIVAPSTIMEDEPIVFDGETSSGAYTYEWNFGEGHKAELGCATHVFMKPDTYNVTLKVKNEANVVSSVQNHTLVVSQLPAATAENTIPINCGSTAADALKYAVEHAVGRTDIVIPNGCEIDMTGVTIFLPYRTENNYVVIRSAVANQLADGSRVSKDNPSDTSKMAKLKTTGHTNYPSIVMSNGETPNAAHHYRFDGIYFSRGDANLPKAERVIVTRTIGLGQLFYGQGSATHLSEVPHHFIFNHCIIENVGNSGTRRGIEANAADLSVLNSSIYNIRAAAGDSHAIGAWTTPGRHAIVNNYLEGGSENILYGGADIYIKNVSPSDITIRGNNLIKPLDWLALERETCPTTRDPNQPCIWRPGAKNHFEIKHAKNLIFDGNNLENSWTGADQRAFSIQVLSYNQDNHPWATARNIQVTNNRIYNSGNGILISGVYVAGTSVPAENILVRNNLFDKIGYILNPTDETDFIATQGRLILLNRPGKRIVFDHNTFVNDLDTASDTNPGSAIALLFDDLILTNNSQFRFTNNLLKVNELGFRANAEDDSRNGIPVLNAEVPGWQMKRNLFFLSNSGICGIFTFPSLCQNYPSDNKYSENQSNFDFQNQFVNYNTANYQLSTGSLGYQYGTDGKDVGVVDFNTVFTQKYGKAISGNWDVP